ncbi:MAG: SdpI family protein [Enterococcus sp.]
MVFLYVGCILLFFGVLFKIFPSRKVNPYYGYRSYVAKKNQKNWQYAQKISANFCLLLGGLTAGIGYTLKMTEHLNFFIIEMLLIPIPVILVFALTEEMLKRYEQTNRGESNERIND